MKFEEVTKKENLIFDGKVLHVYCDDIIRPDGKKATREYAKHLGAVCVVPLTDKDEVICVKQFRYAHHRTFLEIPAGKLDYAGEDRKEAALRELREETGAICEKLTHLGDLVPSPAILTEVISMYLAEGLTFTETEFDDGEFIEIVKIPLSELVEMIMRGEIADAKTQTAILKVWNFKNK
jgi:ADP-ribose pyrophosphatase